MELNYRITVIKSDEVMTARFDTRETAEESIKKIKEQFPHTFITGALEEKKEKWEVVWVINNKICQEQNKRHNYYLLSLKSNSLTKIQDRW